MPRRRKDDVYDEDNDDKASKFGHKPVQRNAANARERARMRVLSKAFCKLKTTLPWVPPDTKLSKLDTLRLASSYIAHLKQILDVDELETAHGYIHPLNLGESCFRKLLANTLEMVSLWVGSEARILGPLPSTDVLWQGQMKVQKTSSNFRPNRKCMEQ